VKPFYLATQYSATETTGPALSYSESPRFLSHLGLNRQWVVKDKQMNEIMIADMR